MLIFKRVAISRPISATARLYPKVRLYSTEKDGKLDVRPIDSTTAGNDNIAGSGSPELSEDQENPEKTTGIIEKDSHQGILYYDHIYPSITRFSFVRKLVPFTYLGNKSKLSNTIRKISFPNLPIEIVNLIPRERDGGVFVTYQIDKQHDIAKTEQEIYDKVESSNYRQWFSPFTPIRAFAVKGTPWIEDLRRYTSIKLKATFEGPDLSQETLYSLLRRYGPIIDIIPPSPGTKDLPRSSSVVFQRYIDAATARNCITGIKCEDTKLHLSFESIDHKNFIKDWIVNHSKLVIPIVVAILAGLTVIIFEPIRVWCIEHHIHGSLFDRYPIVNFVRQQLNLAWNYVVGGGQSLFKRDSSSSSSSSLSHLWDDRIKSIDILKQWIKEGAGTFVIISGPRGGGKEELVLKHALRERDNILTIDCDNLIRVRGDSAFVRSASSEIGYYPVFPWKNSIANYLDVISQGLTGQKTGFAESTESQFKNMLSSASNAIQKLALRDHDQDNDSIENYLQLHPEKKPIIVINHFMSRYESNNQFVYKLLAEWGAQIIQANVAHVIFITSDVGYEKVLSNALPSQVFKELLVGDASSDSARSFVLKQMEEALDDTKDEVADEKKLQPVIEGIEELDEALAPLGGRLTDLQAFARRIKSGDRPMAALKDMVNQSAVEISQMYLTKKSSDWTSEQAWVLIKKLAGLSLDTSEELSFGTLIQDGNFKSASQQEAISMLEHNEMISTRSIGGRIISIRPGKPLYHAAFQALAKDKILSAFMESNILTNGITKEEGNITKYESELAILTKLPTRWETKNRINYLSEKLYLSQKKIEDAEKVINELQTIIKGQVPK